MRFDGEVVASVQISRLDRRVGLRHKKFDLVGSGLLACVQSPRAGSLEICIGRGQQLSGGLA